MATSKVLWEGKEWVRHEVMSIQLFFKDPKNIVVIQATET